MIEERNVPAPTRPSRLTGKHSASDDVLPPDPDDPPLDPDDPDGVPLSDPDDDLPSDPDGGRQAWPPDWDEDEYPVTPSRDVSASTRSTLSRSVTDRVQGRGTGRGPSRAGWIAELREAAADRMPVALRARPPMVSGRAAAVVLLIAITVGVVLLARAQLSDQSGIVLPARSPASRAGPTRAPSTGSVGDRPDPVPPAGAAVAAATDGRGTAGEGGSGMGWGSSGTRTGMSPGPGGVVVDVTGRVHRPGLVRLPAGARVWDAVIAAGGGSAGARLDRINLARPLVDGEQVRVPGPNDPVPAIPDPGSGQISAAAGTGAGPGAGASAAAGRAPVDLNRASVSDLDSLPGVGPVLAARITAWRTQHGRFSRVEELSEVQGIGEKLFAQLRPLVRV